MKVLTVSRQMGSRGDWIAREVARLLGFAYMDREVINSAACQAGIPELALVHIDELGLLGLKSSPQEQRAYLIQVERMLRELCVQGNVVIVGCGGQVVLADEPGVLHVQIIAPFEARVRQLMSEENITEEAAVKRLEKSDKSRAKYLKKNYSVDWLSSLLYDLVINTKKVPPESAIEFIVELLGKD